MKGNDSNSPKTLQATTESIPLAMEFLINLLLRWTCFALAGTFGLLAIVALFKAWTWWILLPALAMAFGTFVCAILISPKGKLVFDGRGPMVIVPAENPMEPCSTKG